MGGMRWAVLSDIHGNLPALEAVLAQMAAEGITRAVQLGDALSGPLWPAETADRLMALGWPAIAGNHERQVLTLPRERMGPSDAHAAERLGPLRAPVVLCGHSHLPRVVTVEGCLVVNPGSVGLPAFDDDHLHPHRAETGSPLARWATIEPGPGGWHAALHATPYAHEQAAQQAERHGRGDWADALRTGRVGRTEREATAAAQTRAGAGPEGTPP